MKTTKQKLELYANSCNELLEAFCKKHDLPYEVGYKANWVNGDIGRVACCGDYFFDMDVIVTDLQEEAAVGQLMEWYDYSTRCTNIGFPSCTYRAWLNGCQRLFDDDFHILEEATTLRNKKLGCDF